MLRRLTFPASSLSPGLWWWVSVMALVLCTAPASAQEQEKETTLRDTIQSLESVRRGPRNALLWSILPGGGQAYNGRFWKVPLVYGGLLGAIAYADFNQTRYDRFVRELNLRCLGDGNVIIIPNQECIPTVGEFDPARISNDALIQARDNTDRARQTAYIGIFIVYVLQAVEAYTDAHLQEFDISDDLSVRLGPVVHPATGIGYGLTVPLGTDRGRRRQESHARSFRRAR